MEIRVGAQGGDCPGLPSGWKREECTRKTGLSAGKTDVYYFSPDGNKVRSKPQLSRHLGESFDLSAFDFRSGRLIHSAIRKSKHQKGSAYDYARGIRHDASLVLPIRQTASIFKQPITVIRTRPESRTKADLKHGIQEQPKQLFWEKRLQGLKASNNDHELIQTLELPKNMHGVGPDLTSENILQSISAALHLSAVPITGQMVSRSALLKNPSINLDANQPHIQHMVVMESDIRRQEEKVLEARWKLQEALKGAAL